MTVERSNAVSLTGKPLTLVGVALRPGDRAPDFEAVGEDLTTVRLADTGPGVRIFSVVPSLDTPVCDAQSRRFNEEAAQLPNIQVFTVSMDLPFAQKRWCEASGVRHVKFLSDHMSGSFGSSYGTLIKELRLNCRAVLVLDSQDTVRHAEYVREVADQPDYEAALKVARRLVSPDNS